MPSIRISKADRKDDADILQFSASFASEGNLKLALDRSPSFFDSIAKDGENPEIIIGRDIISNQLVGIGYKIESNFILKSKRFRFGYLAGLRLLKEYRSGIALARGYKKLKELHDMCSCHGYFTTIQSENQNAIEILSSHRAGLPYYQFLTHLTTFIWNPKVYKKSSNLSVEVVKDSYEYKSFVENTKRAAYLMPEWEDSFYENPNIVRYLIKDGEKIVSSFSLWDQSKFKRWRVIDYSKWIKKLRKLYNVYASVKRLPKLPTPGSPLDYQFLTQLCISEEYINRLPEVFSKIFATSSENFPDVYLCYTLSKEDPWFPIVNKIPSWKIQSLAYYVHWNPANNFFNQKIEGFSIWETGLL
ncbi:hypothetical protein EHQ92_00760 [Leptospira biflexa]|uniref:hypothetical protein n=1 Tax=Leptospira biflexa TaxID=172 RepID=UPI00109144E1|nr:hypothetical protein [Leptospira biflexa]TGM46488.1 hypothetical protein EHQ92_00760 [Leptospira biflexa]TGM51050.1 hypothetical protein EHQ88_12325 [Leptospira biflexa]